MKAALYRWYDSDGNLLYIGHTIQLAGRVDHHLGRSRWVVLAARLAVDWYPSLEDAMEAESEAIEAEFPVFNTNFNDPAAADARREVFLAERGMPDLLRKSEDELALEGLRNAHPGWRIWISVPGKGHGTWHARPSSAKVTTYSAGDLEQQIVQSERDGTVPPSA